MADLFHFPFTFPLDKFFKPAQRSMKMESRTKRLASSLSSGSQRQKIKPIPQQPAPPNPHRNFSDLHADILLRIAAPFDLPELWATSSVCRQWRRALLPLREAMVLVRWGKRFKHGDGGRTNPCPAKALESFLKGAARGSAAAMVDAGLMYWEMGRKEEGKAMYLKAAEMGYPAAQCNLGNCYLQADDSKPEEAVKWFYLAAESGYAGAQYNLALCLHKGHGVGCSLPDAATWYVKAAKGGNVRAMYNASLCYSLGECGIKQDLRRAKAWMKRAADCGHSKAQLEHGLDLYEAGELMQGLVYLELAKRAGEADAAHTRDAILQSLPETARNHGLLSADKWKPLKFGS